MTIDKNKYGLTADGKSVDIYTLKNSNGIEVSIITYGGIITSIKTPNKKGFIENIVLGYDSLQDYIKDKSYLGAIIGPYANRIAKSQFTLDGNLYNLEKNDGPNNLHSGPNGFDKVLWNASTKINKND
ncbi:MAG: galactose-1-epimerase, partial [Algibacter sp.]